MLAAWGEGSEGDAVGPMWRVAGHRAWYAGVDARREAQAVVQGGRAPGRQGRQQREQSGPHMHKTAELPDSQDLKRCFPTYEDFNA